MPGNSLEVVRGQHQKQLQQQLQQQQQSCAGGAALKPLHMLMYSNLPMLILTCVLSQKKNMHLMDGIYEHVFVKPGEAYKAQVLVNEQSLRMFKAEKRLLTKDKADKVSEAMQAEGATSSKAIKVMILDVAKRAQRQKDRREKKSRSQKTLRGAQAVVPKQRKLRQRKRRSHNPQPPKMEQEAKAMPRPKKTQTGNQILPKQCEEEKESLQRKNGK